MQTCSYHIRIHSSRVRTWIGELSAHSQHHLPVAGSIGHELQNLFVRFAFDGNAVNTDELIPGPQTPVLLCGTQRNNCTNVHLKRDDMVTGHIIFHCENMVTNQRMSTLTGWSGPSPPSTLNPNPVSWFLLINTSSSLVLAAGKTPPVYLYFSYKYFVIYIL